MPSTILFQKRSFIWLQLFIHCKIFILMLCFADFEETLSSRLPVKHFYNGQRKNFCLIPHTGEKYLIVEIIVLPGMAIQ